MINTEIFGVITLIITGSLLIGTENVSAQYPSKHTYEDSDISLQYPYYWMVEKVTPNKTGSDERYVLIFHIDEDVEFTVDVRPLGQLSPPITTLKDFARYQYTRTHTNLNVIGDNQTTVGGDHPALQMEYSFNFQSNQRHGLIVWTIDMGKGYQFTYSAIEGPKFSANLPLIRNVLNSIEFSPSPEPTSKVPSFMK